MTLRADRSPAGPVEELVATAVGRAHREDPVLPRTGGPAGNARLTAWLGIVLLVLFIAECVTLLSLRGLISVHIGLGTVLVPIVAAKTGVTGWRIFRYYTGNRDYVQAGPPPVLLRLLGPFVILTGFAVLGSGLALIPLGRDGTRSTFVTIAGQALSPLGVHKLCFVAWLGVVGAHTLARLVPALRLAGGRPPVRRVPGARSRAVAMLLVLAIGAVAGTGVTLAAGAWTNGRFGHDDFRGHEHDRG